MCDPKGDFEPVERVFQRKSKGRYVIGRSGPCESSSGSIATVALLTLFKPITFRHIVFFCIISLFWVEGCNTDKEDFELAGRVL